mgnify:CR=1 FL=1
MHVRNVGTWIGLIGSAAAVVAIAAAACWLTPGCLRAEAADGQTKANNTSGFASKGVAKMVSLEQTEAGKVHHASTATFADMVLRSKTPVLVDFYADWCGPCQRLSPILEQVAAEMPDARVVKVNVDQNPELAAHYNISSIPAMMVFKDGRVVDQTVGLVGKAQIKAMLQR